MNTATAIPANAEEFKKADSGHRIVVTRVGKEPIGTVMVDVYDQGAGTPMLKAKVLWDGGFTLQFTSLSFSGADDFNNTIPDLVEAAIWCAHRVLGGSADFYPDHEDTWGF